MNKQELPARSLHSTGEDIHTQEKQPTQQILNVRKKNKTWHRNGNPRNQPSARDALEPDLRKWHLSLKQKTGGVGS